MNKIYKKEGINKRINELIFEFDAYINGANPSGNSLTQRFVYWKNGWEIAMSNLAFGVGTGDTKQEFNNLYMLKNSQLNKENWKRAHNQFLTFLLTYKSSI